MTAKRRLRQVHEFELVPSGPFDLDLTINKPRYGYWLTPEEQHGKNVHWSGTWFGGVTPIGLRVGCAKRGAQPSVRVGLFTGKADLPASAVRSLERRVADSMGINDDLDEFYLAAKEYPILRRCIHDLYGMRDTRAPEIFSGIILAFTLQNTTWKSTVRMLDLLHAKLGTTICFDHVEMRIGPRPMDIAQASTSLLAKQCLLGYRAAYLQRVAKVISGGFPDHDELRSMSPEKASEKLLTLPGIGPYSVDIVSPHVCFPVDRWSAPILRDLFGLKVSDDRKKMVREIRLWASSSFGKWQGYVYAYLMHDLHRLRPDLS